MTATNMCYNFVGFRYSPPLPEIKCFQSLTVEEQIVLKWRAGLSKGESSIETICHSHKWYFAEQT